MEKIKEVLFAVGTVLVPAALFWAVCWFGVNLFGR